MIVYTVQWRKHFGTGWTLDDIFKSRRLALKHIEWMWGNDPGVDVKIEEHEV